jgi:uncharacterized HAD superfamily protein
MKIGIDIDNTIAPTFKTIIKYLNKKYKLNKLFKDSKESTGYDLFHAEFKYFYNDWKEFVYSKEHHSMKPIKGSVEVIKKLSEKHQIYILTARANYQNIQTGIWIDKHYKNKFEEILFLEYCNKENTKPLFTKGDLCKKFNIDIMIEDDLSQARIISEKSKKTKIFLFDKDNSYTWNKERPLPKNTIKVSSWKEIEKEIK